jgi:hypothetical protein
MSYGSSGTNGRQASGCQTMPPAADTAFRTKAWLNEHGELLVIRPAHPLDFDDERSDAIAAIAGVAMRPLTWKDDDGFPLAFGERGGLPRRVKEVAPGQGVIWSVGEDARDDGGKRGPAHNDCRAGEDRIFIVPLPPAAKR